MKPQQSLMALPFALCASIALWLCLLAIVALAFRMEGKSLKHSVKWRVVHLVEQLK